MSDSTDSKTHSPKVSSPKIKDKDLIAAEKLVIDRNPLYLIQGEFLRIKTKQGELVPLKLNKPQKYILSKINKLRLEKKPVRAWILKARQLGVSTLSEAIIYALTSQQENRTSLIMADEDDKSKNLFSMSKLYQEQLEKEHPVFAPKLKRSNEKALEFEDIHSKIIIETAHNVDAARSYTFVYTHLSECAFFRDLDGVMTGLNQSVPDYWDTVILGETTAKGRNLFYKEWLRAIEGKTDWLPIFIPWFWMEEYSMPLNDGELYPVEGIKFTSDESVDVFIQEEAEIISEYDLTREQANWRRWAIVNKCNGRMDSFKTEYPICWEEAFMMSGSMYFDRKGMQGQEKRIERPKRLGEVFYQDMKWEFRDLPDGRIRVYEEPDESEQYLVALDASEGITSGDEAAGVVLNKRLNTVVAAFNGTFSPEELASIGVNVANYYNKALLIPENKGYGYAVCQKAYQTYGNIYRKKIKDAEGERESKELGWNTNVSTRPQMLAQLDDEIRNNSTTLIDKQLWSEMMTFVQQKDQQGNLKKPEAERGCQDGLVICRGICSIVRMEHPFVVKHSKKNWKRAEAQDRLKKQKRNAGYTF